VRFVIATAACPVAAISAADRLRQGERPRMLSYVASDLATLEEDSRLAFSLGIIEQRTRDDMPVIRLARWCC
jgi:hypothetical protein